MNYLVKWEIDIEDAASPEEAARRAKEIQMDRDSISNVFTVEQTDKPETALEVDLDEIDIRAARALLEVEQTMKKLGFNAADTGGGCQAYHKPTKGKDDGWLYITSEAELPTSIDDVVQIGLYDENGEQVADMTEKLEMFLARGFKETVKLLKGGK